jgi:hypothetical protein
MAFRMRGLEVVVVVQIAPQKSQSSQMEDWGGYSTTVDSAVLWMSFVNPIPENSKARTKYVFQCLGKGTLRCY